MTSDSVSTEQGEPDPDLNPQPGAMPEPTQADLDRRRRNRRWWGIAIFAAVAAAIVAAMFLIRLPYYVVQPGSVRPSEQRIQISGTKSFETPGKVMFTTVYINQASPALMVRYWLDSSFELHTRAEMYPDGDRVASQRQNVALMDASKVLATKVALSEVGIPAEFSGNGAIVVGLVKGSPSEGILEPGDRITEVDGGAVSLPSDIGDELADRKPGDVVSVVVVRPSRSDPEKPSRKNLKVELGASEKEPARPVFGIQVEPSGLKVVSDVDVDVDSGTVTGPSAGLAWTLAIIDRLTPGSLTDGRNVAVTGEIFADGTVGPIGGVEQKVSAVKRAGIKVFIYPSATPKDEQKAMREVAGKNVKLYPVANIEEAVKVLAPNGLGTP
ncbi:MAG TPA: S16 family serine protease [Microthrixaceae bacterium]|nr:S16 family serine protease [Microthrixaceae bacterium]